MKIIILCTAFMASVIAEPPVDNRYLPPQQGLSSSIALSAPSQTYGPPGTNGFGQKQTDAVFRSRPSSSYGPPSASHGSSRRPSSQYGPPSFGTPSNQYIPPNSQPSSRYGPPSFESQPSSQYGTPGTGMQVSDQYGAPGLRSPPSSQYGAPGFGGRGQSGRAFGQQSRPQMQYGAPAPSQQYGAPNTGFGANEYSAGGAGGFGGAQSREYLPPGGASNRGYGDDQDNYAPANYNFEYMVKDDASGNDFGHRESRQGDRAQGQYYVLLPDGRKQTVEYEADQDGYKPRISYEDTGAGQGYGRNNQGYQDNGYQNNAGGY